MKKDYESLLRMSHLLAAAKMYENAAPEMSQNLLKDFIQVSEKKMIRM